MEKTVYAMEDKPNRKNIMEDWKDYTTEDATVVREKDGKAVRPKTINSCWRKLCPDVVHDFTGFMADPIKELMKEIVDMV